MNFLANQLLHFLQNLWLEYFAERNNYMRYCLAYSTPLKTLNSAR
ncbi:unnamed protein product [Meloidogyne enterolobii]|uniref:Uncharacterized protein n=1 Tax=Meloidogyne enterolobii TaxID=390850 RepID=A0ACB0Y6K8_MELEN